MGLFHKLRPKCGPAPGCGPLQALFHRFLTILDMTSLQTMQYVAFLYAFQTLVSTFHTPSAKWFTKYLENTITDATVNGKELTITRKSHLGLSALEIALLTRWLDNPQFPKPTLEWPKPAETPRAKPRRIKPRKKPAAKK